MENKCYLLSVKELWEENAGERLFRTVLDRVDKDRREKTGRMRPGAGRAASLGAGLILQLAVQAALREAIERIESKDTDAERKRLVFEKSVAEDGKARKHENKKEDKNNRDGKNRKAGEKLRVYTVPQVLRLLEEPLDLKLDYSEKGKPYLRDYPFYFNLSHSGEYVFCAISDREVGVDIQQFRKTDEMRLARRFFSEEERKALGTRLDREEWRQLFYRLWTRKEAYGKLTGEGIVASLGRSMLPADERLSLDVELLAQQSVERVMPMAASEESLFWQEWSLSEYWAAMCQYKA